MAFLTGRDVFYRLDILPQLIRQYIKTDDEKYLRQAEQICIDTAPKIKKFKRSITRKIEELKKVKNG